MVWAYLGPEPVPLLPRWDVLVRPEFDRAVQIHVLAAASEQAHVFSIEGHRWPFEPGRNGTPMISSTQLSGLDALTLRLVAGSASIGWPVSTVWVEECKSLD